MQQDESVILFISSRNYVHILQLWKVGTVTCLVIAVGLHVCHQKRSERRQQTCNDPVRAGFADKTSRADGLCAR